MLTRFGWFRRPPPPGARRILLQVQTGMSAGLRTLQPPSGAATALLCSKKGQARLRRSHCRGTQRRAGGFEWYIWYKQRGPMGRRAIVFLGFEPGKGGTCRDGSRQHGITQTSRVVHYIPNDIPLNLGTSCKVTELVCCGGIPRPPSLFFDKTKKMMMIMTMMMLDSLGWVQMICRLPAARCRGTEPLSAQIRVSKVETKHND